MAECSESTGRMGVLYSRAKDVTNSPATTIVSLLASAMTLPALMASIVGHKPAKPTIDAKTISIGSACTIWLRDSEPAKTFMGCPARASRSLG